MKYQISSFELFKQMLSELEYDPNKSWHEYPCLEWPRHRGAGTYGIVRAFGKLNKAHRLAYELSSGSIPQGLKVYCHHCDNPPYFHHFASLHGNAIR